MKQVKHGYIMIMALMLISAIVVVVSLIYERSSVFMPYMSTVNRKEQAAQLALGGIEIARAQLAQVPEVSDKEKEKKSPSAEDDAKNLLKHVLPALNRWQTFGLTKKIDGINGTISVSISSEEGKIPLNRIYDFKNKKFIGQNQPSGDWKVFLEGLFKKLKAGTVGSDLFSAFESFLKKQSGPIQDVTQLMVIPEFSLFTNVQFYTPPTQEEKTRPLYLTDIFTTYGSSTLQPWLFSDSLLGMLGMKRAQANDVKAREKSSSAWIKKFKTTSSWKQDWQSIMQPIYGKDLAQLPKAFESYLSPSFSPTFFGVRSHGTVQGVTVQLYAILERTKRTKNGTLSYDINIKQLYWL